MPSILYIFLTKFGGSAYTGVIYFGQIFQPNLGGSAYMRIGLYASIYGKNYFPTAHCTVGWQLHKWYHGLPISIKTSLYGGMWIFSSQNIYIALK